MGIPPAAGAHVKLHEPHAAFDKPPGDQAIPGVVGRLALGRGRRARSVSAGSSVRSTTSGAVDLHLVRQFVGGDAGFERIVFASGSEQ